MVSLGTRPWEAREILWAARALGSSTRDTRRKPLVRSTISATAVVISAACARSG